MFNKPTSGDHLEADLATFTMTLVNKTLFGVPDQDTFYDQSDYMEELGIEGACNRLWDCWDAYGAADGVEVEAEGLLQQIQLYNVALKQEDGEPVTEDEIRRVEWDWEVPSGTGMYPNNPIMNPEWSQGGPGMVLG